ncbi:hypothetical protein HOLleu_25296 [Holothuria leucospilota]|uniref:Transglutaminase-like domain-containing protein n=1 Tax=Holothuria leucospilota TaxID=206669 RepID=A0A9Q1BSN3_HOLLE|nr:hypothetical protein HOLleu_25296 [Holothuria leucospilota]
MGCGSSKVSDVSQPVPVQAEGALNVKNEATKSNAGINGGLKNEGNIELNDNTKLIDNDNAVNVDNSHDVNSHDVSGKGETALDNESKEAVEGRHVGKDGSVKDTDHTIVEKVKGGSKQKSKATYTTSKSKVKTTNDEGSIISKNKDEPTNDKNITEETTTNSTTKQTGKGAIKEKRSVSTDKSEEVDIKNIHKDKDVGLTDNAKEGNALETASTVKQNNSNKLASTKASVISTNKNIPNANSTKNKDKVVADDTPKGKASGAASNKTTGQKSKNAKSSITSTTSSGPANSVKNTVAKGRKQRAEKRPVISQPKWRHDYDIPIVDPEEGLGDLPEIYKGMEQPVKIEDTFWSGKRKVIPDFQVMRDIDKHTLAAPQNIKTNLKRLVQYLIKPAKNDVGKYRAIARWIGQNIDYDADVYFRGIKNSPSDPQSVLTKGSAVCAGYSKLFQAMCK